MNAYDLIDWSGYREDYDPPDRDGVGGVGRVGHGDAEQEAIVIPIEREAEDRA